MIPPATIPAILELQYNDRTGVLYNYSTPVALLMLLLSGAGVLIGIGVGVGEGVMAEEAPEVTQNTCFNMSLRIHRTNVESDTFSDVCARVRVCR